VSTQSLKTSLNGWVSHSKLVDLVSLTSCLELDLSTMILPGILYVTAVLAAMQFFKQVVLYIVLSPS
jgi:hypothetical protein